jgi:probable biosynthetic protein (TIGR04098 family)
MHMHQYAHRWHLGMPHTISGAVGEIALLAHAQDLHWKEMGSLTGCPASRQVSATGEDVYASIFYVDLEAPPDRGLAAFGPDDTLEIEGTFGRYGPSMLDGTHRLRALRDGPDGPAIRLRLSFVLVAMGAGPDDLRISVPANAAIERIPGLVEEPDSYRVARAAQAAGGLDAAPAGARALWDKPRTRTYAINPDRDLNGVGLLYFANYVAFLDAAERDTLEAEAGIPAARLDGRVTVQRRIAYYGNARSSDRLQVTVDCHAYDGPPAERLLVRHAVRRVSDGRLVALATATRLLRPPSS